VKGSYYGGMTGNTKKIVKKKLYKYDVNSMYPANMLGKMPKKMEKLEVFNKEITCLSEALELDPDVLYELKSFKFKDDTYLPFFPVRKGDLKKGNGLYYPLESDLIS